MSDLLMCRHSTCKYAENCERHWKSGTQEKVFGQKAIAHHRLHKGHSKKTPCLGYLPKDEGFKPGPQNKKGKTGKDLA